MRQRKVFQHCRLRDGEVRGGGVAQPTQIGKRKCQFMKFKSFVAKKKIAISFVLLSLSALHPHPLCCTNKLKLRYSLSDVWEEVRCNTRTKQQQKQNEANAIQRSLYVSMNTKLGKATSHGQIENKMKKQMAKHKSRARSFPLFKHFFARCHLRGKEKSMMRTSNIIDILYLHKFLFFAFPFDEMKMLFFLRLFFFLCSFKLFNVYVCVRCSVLAIYCSFQPVQFAIADNIILASKKTRAKKNRETRTRNWINE